MSFEYGVHRSVVESYVYNVFNNGEGVYGQHYDMMIEFIMDETSYCDVDFFSRDVYELMEEIESDFFRFYTEEIRDLNLIENWICFYYGNGGFTLIDIGSKLACFDKETREELKQRLACRML